MPMLGHLISYRVPMGRDRYGPVWGASQYAAAWVEAGGKRTIDQTGREYIPAYTLVTREPIEADSVITIISGPGGKDAREYVVKAVKAASTLDGQTLYEVLL